MRKRVFVDPDFGEIELPAPPSRREFDEAGRQAIAAMVSRRHWPKGSLEKCSECGRMTFEGREDLEYRITRPGAVLVFRHLRGAKCATCGAQAIEPEDLIEVESEAGVGIVGDYKAKVCNIGTGTLGTYWPQDVVRNLRLSPEKLAFIQVVDEDTVLITFRRGAEGIIARDPGKKTGKTRRRRRSGRKPRAGQ
ncbi:MAG TPA: hypothetical protein VI893_06125 [Thermoplasmata archaeon]|nr:hypothetical protein [Thermoplasmata archaeon]